MEKRIIICRSLDSLASGPSASQSHSCRKEDTEPGELSLGLKNPVESKGMS